MEVKLQYFNFDGEAVTTRRLIQRFILNSVDISNRRKEALLCRDKHDQTHLGTQLTNFANSKIIRVALHSAAGLALKEYNITTDGEFKGNGVRELQLIPLAVATSYINYGCNTGIDDDKPFLVEVENLGIEINSKKVSTDPEDLLEKKAIVTPIRRGKPDKANITTKYISVGTKNASILGEIAIVGFGTYEGKHCIFIESCDDPEMGFAVKRANITVSLEGLRKVASVAFPDDFIRPGLYSMKVVNSNRLIVFYQEEHEDVIS